MSYFNAAQIAQLLAPLNPARVGKDGKGFSHLEAWEVRRHLIRVFGHARWSCDLTELEQVYETEHSEDPKKTRWSVCYRATVCLRVCAPDGEELASYTEAACGDATNYPSRADAHDQAIKTAESQAFKRAAVNLGDGFGLSLYANGSTDAVVGRTLVNEAPAVAGLGKQPETPVPAPQEAPEPPSEPAAAVSLVDQIASEARSATSAREITMLLTKATKHKVQSATVGDEHGEAITLGALLQAQLARLTAKTDAQ